jgi:hypothetical protein
MNNKPLLSLILAVLIIGGGILIYQNHTSNSPYTNAPVTTNTAGNGSTPVVTTPVDTTSTNGTAVATNDIKISTPRSGQLVASPLSVSGQARGSWFFEASAPVYLEDASGKKIAQGTIHATGDWMTTNFVPFTGTLTWSASSTATSTGNLLKGSVIFMNDNPSGDPSLQKTVSVPVVYSR